MIEILDLKEIQIENISAGGLLSMNLDGKRPSMFVGYSINGYGKSQWLTTENRDKMFDYVKELLLEQLEDKPTA